MRYLFKSCTVCKNSRFWIDAATLAEACEKYAEAAAADGVKISKTQLKNPRKIYFDDKDGNAHQGGYSYKATTDIYDEERQKWTQCRAEIWATVSELTNPFEK